MKINIIREFVRLCETQNFTRTAEELCISQPVLSRHIAALEEEMGTVLISRTGNTFELTKAGQTALESFRKILQEYQALLTRVSVLSDEEPGELHCGVLRKSSLNGAAMERRSRTSAPSSPAVRT